MSSVAVETAGIEPPARPSPAGWWASLVRVLKPLASLRLTVVLLSLSVVLVFVGTIAQVDDSIHTVLNKYFYTWIAWVPFDIFVRFGQKFLGVAQETHIAGSLPFPGGWTLGFALMLNLVAAHATRFKLGWQRTGIWMIHVGVIILLLGEFLSSQLKIESQMRIPQGEQVNFVEDTQKVELAIVDASDPNEDQVFVIPEHLLRQGGHINDPALPVDVDVVRYMASSELTNISDKENPATSGLGTRFGAAVRRETSGVATGQRQDIAAAYVRFVDRNGGKDLGTYLVTPWYQAFKFLEKEIQVLTVGNKHYSIALRPSRTYLPYSLHLNEFRFDRFVGTSIARNYSSDVRLIDPERQVDRQLRISMNEPLRYQGRTFYQTDFDHATETTTYLSVVKNRAWMAPYFACGLAALGMIVHFGIHLNKFVRKRAAR